MGKYKEQHAAWPLLALWCVQSWVAADSSGNSWEIDAVMPEHPAPPETYLCSRVDLPEAGSLKLTGIEPLSKEELVHHMLLFGCDRKTDSKGAWDCRGHSVCPGGGSQQILYGWAKGAPPMHLPDGVGYKVGPGTRIDNLVLQIHFGVERPHGDVSGVKLHLTDSHVPFSAGMLMYASSFQIPPRQEEHLVPNRCCYPGFEPAHGFAFRVHTHTLGRSVYLDEVLRDDSRRRMVEHSPQLPQGFTPVSGLTFWPGQGLEATCAFNSMERSDATWAGATHHHEMCNLYMIMWSELPVFINCYDSHTAVDRHGVGGLPSPAALLPEDASFWQPPQSLADISQPPAGPVMGQVAGVARGHNGSVWVFHRGDRVWDGATFTGPRFEQVTLTEPIRQATVLQLDQDTGKVLASWGEGMFLMPHMVTVDQWGFVWLTDVGLHQVFKFDPAGHLLLTLGQRLQPGDGASFCKPTQVAVANNGEVFVSDGYCNARVAHFASDGTHLGDFTLAGGPMNVPHSLVLDECEGALMVADREAAQVHRFELASRKHTGTWDLSKEGLVFGLAVGPYGTLIALCWDRGIQMGGASKLVLLHSDPNKRVEESWKLEGVESPHDLALVAAPVRLAGTNRPLAVLVAETRLSHSRLHKFILLPAGTTALPAVNASELLPSATEQWTAVLAASTLTPQGGHTEDRPETQQEIPAELAATKATDIAHSQTTTSGVESAHPHHATHQHGTPQAVRQRGTLAFDKQSAGEHYTRLMSSGQQYPTMKTALVVVPMLICCGALTVAYRYFSRL